MILFTSILLYYKDFIELYTPIPFRTIWFTGVVQSNILFICYHLSYKKSEYTNLFENSYHTLNLQSIFVNVYNGPTTYLLLVYICLHITDHPPTPICKRKLWTPPIVFIYKVFHYILHLFGKTLNLEKDIHKVSIS